MDTDLAQFFTIGNAWLTGHVKDFILEHAKNGILDPFAGKCDLQRTLVANGITADFVGYDIDEELKNEVVKINDSLLYIPHDGRMIITNPPYGFKNSVTKRGSQFEKYFRDTNLSDIYMVALQRCLAEHKFVVAIIPESFLLRNFFHERLCSLSIITGSMFEHTTCPVCVCCWGARETDPKNIKIYMGEEYLFNLAELLGKMKIPKYTVEMKFKKPNGNLGLRGFDGLRKNDRIKFCRPEELNYDPEKVATNCGTVSIINVPSIPDDELDEFIERCNCILAVYRAETSDCLLSVFWKHRVGGISRRRLGFRTARAIIEEAVESKN